MSEKGYFVIADITGYTAFLSKAELDHADDILQGLLKTMLEQIEKPLILSKLEGDAIFTYAPVGSFLRGQSLLDSIEKTYCAFALARENMNINTTCDCNACTLIPSLDLKFVAHYGDYLIQRITQQEELVGTDVNIVHRLLKNSIVEDTGVPSYAFFSEACADAMMLGDLKDVMITHSETYDHVGEIKGYVYDLKPVLARARLERRIFINLDDSTNVVEGDIPVDPPVAWDYLHDAEYKRQMFELDQVNITPGKNGRMGEGSMHHCLHSEGEFRENYIDWQPFEYATFQFMLPPDGWITVTTRLTSIENGTHIAYVYGEPEGEGKKATKQAIKTWAKMKDIVFEAVEAGLSRLVEMAEKDLAAGKITSY